MSGQFQEDRRKHVRYPMATSVQFYHGPSRRDYPARSADVSQGGMLMYVPASVPVLPGQPIRVTVAAAGLPGFGSMSNAPLDATIVRVDRRGILNSGHLPVGVRFAQPVV